MNTTPEVTRVTPTIESMRRIVASRQRARVGDRWVDPFAASAVVSIYDRLNEETKREMAAMSVTRMCGLALQFGGAS